MTDLRWSLACGPGPDGHWHGTYRVQISAAALRRLGLHPDQPTAHITNTTTPPWWHYAAERSF